MNINIHERCQLGLSGLLGLSELLQGTSNDSESSEGEGSESEITARLSDNISMLTVILTCDPVYMYI